MSENYSDRGYLDLVAKDLSQRHVTAREGQKCGYCKKPVPAEAIGNPLWMWKKIQGNGLSVFCDQNCMDWRIFRMRCNAFKAKPMKSYNGRVKLTYEQFVTSLISHKEVPVLPDPLSGAEPPRMATGDPQDAPQDEVQNNPTESVEAVTEPVQAESEPVNEQIDQDDEQIEQDAVEEGKSMEELKETTEEIIEEPVEEIKTSRLKRSIGELKLEGQNITATVYRFKDHLITELDAVEMTVNADTLAELRELADTLEELMGGDVL